MNLTQIIEEQRLASPCVAPQTLAWDGKTLWLSSRDLGTLYRLEKDPAKIAEEIDPPGVVWAGVLTNDGWRFTIGKGLNDDRYVYRFSPRGGFEKLFACPEFTGSYLSFDGLHLYLSQWYKGQIHRVDDSGKISRTIEVDAEICGHTFVEGTLYVLRGRENNDLPGVAEEWRIARVDPPGDGARWRELPAHTDETGPLEAGAIVKDLAAIPFAARSLAFDGESFWSNHRAANEVVAFGLPG